MNLFLSKKWILNFTYNLKQKPKNWEDRIKNAFLIRDITWEEFDSRYETVKNIYKDIYMMVYKSSNDNISPIERDIIKCFNNVIKKKGMKKDKFMQKYGKSVLNTEPGYYFLYIKDDYIHFNMDKYYKEKRRNFSNFLSWNQLILENITFY